MGIIFGIIEGVLFVITKVTGLTYNQINIHEFHCIYWGSAPEFDDDSYFLNLEEAITYAKNVMSLI